MSTTIAATLTQAWNKMEENDVEDCYCRLRTSIHSNCAALTMEEQTDRNKMSLPAQISSFMIFFSCERGWYYIKKKKNQRF